MKCENPVALSPLLPAFLGSGADTNGIIPGHGLADRRFMGIEMLVPDPDVTRREGGTRRSRMGTGRVSLSTSTELSFVEDFIPMPMVFSF
ncbi:MAG: hypothetical protein WCI03_02915 [bacterium]